MIEMLVKKNDCEKINKLFRAVIFTGSVLGELYDKSSVSGKF